MHCVKSVRIRSYTGSNFSALGLNTDQNNSEYGHVLRSDVLQELSSAEECWCEFSSLCRLLTASVRRNDGYEGSHVGEFSKQAKVYRFKVDFHLIIFFR